MWTKHYIISTRTGSMNSLSELPNCFKIYVNFNNVSTWRELQLLYLLDEMYEVAKRCVTKYSINEFINYCGLCAQRRSK